MEGSAQWLRARKIRAPAELKIGHSAAVTVTRDSDPLAPGDRLLNWENLAKPGHGHATVTPQDHARSHDLESRWITLRGGGPCIRTATVSTTAGDHEPWI